MTALQLSTVIYSAKGVYLKNLEMEEHLSVLVLTFKFKITFLMFEMYLTFPLQFSPL